jgi:hypothetical protein
MSARCGKRGKRFCVETADEYTFANASSVSSTVSASSASAAAAPPPAIAVRISSGWLGSTPRERTRIEPVDHRRDDGPDRELPYEPADEADRAEQRQHRRDAAEEELPEPDRLKAEQLVAQQTGRGGDHDQLEDRPAQALQDVQAGREIRATAAERGSLQHHRRDARVGADQRRDREHAVSDQTADERCRERGAQRQVEVRRQDEHQQRDAEVRPQQRSVDQPEHVQALGDRLDSPTGRVPQSRG